MGHYHKEANGRRSRIHPHLELSRGRQAASKPMPKLPQPFVANGDCHYTLTFDDITATLFYSRTEELWTVTFSQSGIIVGSYNQLDRDMPAQEMQAKIILAIMARHKSNDDYLIDSLPTGDVPGQDEAPRCYGIGPGEY